MNEPGSTYGHVSAATGGWWRDLQQTPSQKGDRASLARLRRCSVPRDAMVEPATFWLFRRLGMTSPRSMPKVSLIAMTLAHVRDEVEERHPVRAVGRLSINDEDSAAMKLIRFRRLLACRDDDDDALDEFARQMRRFVALAGRRIDVGELGASLFFWNDKTRTRWAFEYFAAGNAAPDAVA